MQLKRMEIRIEEVAGKLADLDARIGRVVEFRMLPERHLVR